MGSIGGLEYEVPQSRLYCLCINVALCSTALQCVCRVIRRSSMTMKAHTYYIIFGRPPIGEASPLPLAAPLTLCRYVCMHVTIFSLTTLQLTRLTASSLLPHAPRTHSALRRRSSVRPSVCLSVTAAAAAAYCVVL